MLLAEVEPPGAAVEDEEVALPLPPVVERVITPP